MLRGTTAGLEFVFGVEAFAVTADEMVARLTERPGFYRGARATVVFTEDVPSEETVLSFIARIAEFDIEIARIAGDRIAKDLAERLMISYVGEPARAAVIGARREAAAVASSAAPASRNAESRNAELTQTARSLDADFAGARADLAARRTRRAAREGASLAAVADPTARIPTRYHRGTLRSGKALQFAGNIVIVGDVNPGAEVVASGDIVIMGALRGIAHAGAQGDATARVIALELRPTQLRVSTHIAADGDERGTREPEEAFVADGRIAIAPLGKGPR